MDQFDDELQAAEIEATVNIFKHFSFACHAQDWKWMKIDGDVFGKSKYNYWVQPMKPGFNVQVCDKRDVNGVCYWFGIYFGKDETFPIQNPHGPFRMYYDNINEGVQKD